MNGDRLREGGDAARAEMISADPQRVAASCASLRGMTNAVQATREPDIVQVMMMMLVSLFLFVCVGKVTVELLCPALNKLCLARFAHLVDFLLPLN